MFYLIIALAVSIIINITVIRSLIKRGAINMEQVHKNRYDMLDVVRDAYENGKIDRASRHYFAHVCHPDFRNPFDYVPPTRFSYESKIRDLDKNFWREYKLTPDFRINVRYVYEAYREYLLKHSQLVSELYFETFKPVKEQHDNL